MYLSYSGYKSFTSCPRMYWHQYVAKTQLPIPENKVNSLFGTVIGGLFETFYRDRIWRESGVESKLLGLVQSHFDQTMIRELRGGAVRWKGEDPKSNYESPDELLADVRTAIPRGLAIIRYHRLLGPEQSEAEIKLDQCVGEHTIGGRADFLIKRVAPHGDLILLDGKGSKWRDKYVDARQLKWYALLHRIKYGFMPDKIGFVFWRSEAEKALDWVDFSEVDLLELQTSILDVMDRIEGAKKEVSKFEAEVERRGMSDAQFPVSPGERCRLCAFKAVCPDGQHFASIRVAVPDGAGVEDVGFNG